LFRGNIREQQACQVLDGLAFHVFERMRVDHGRLGARVPEQGLQDRHGDARIPVQRAEGVTERMPAETGNAQEPTGGPQVPSHEVAVTERRSYGARE